MEASTQSIDELTRLGLTTYEAKAYAALLGRDSFTAAEIARRAGVPRARIYDVMRSLIDRGLASSRPGGVVRYSAMPPATAVERLLDEHRSRMKQIESTGNALIDRLEPEFHSGREHTEPLDFIQVLRGNATISQYAADISETAREEILVFTKPPIALPVQDNVKGLAGVRRYRARSIYEIGLLGDPATVDGIRRFIEAGEEARFVEELPLKMALIDRSLVMFALEDPVASNAEATMMVVEHPALANALCITFEAMWDEGITFEEALTRVGTEA